MDNTKARLFEILDNPKDKLVAVDLDGTLCLGRFWGDNEPEPIVERIRFINRLYKAGAHIVIYTARDPIHMAVTSAWLLKYGVMYHGINMMRKPAADIYIDDSALNADDVFDN